MSLRIGGSLLTFLVAAAGGFSALRPPQISDRIHEADDYYLGRQNPDNVTKGLEKRFLSRCKVLEFDASSVNGDLLAMMRRIWQREAPDAPLPDFALIENDARGNIRDALNKLEVELMAV